MDISEVPVCHLLWQMSSQWGSQQWLQGLVSHELTAYFSVWDLFLTQQFLAILSKGCKPGNFELHNSLKLRFTNICNFHLNYVEYESLLESRSPDILALCEKNLDDSIDSGNLTGKVYLPLIQKNFIAVAVYVKEGLPFAWGLPLENSDNWYLCLWLALLHLVSYFFFLYRSSSSSLCMVFDSVISSINEVPLTKISGNVFLFGDFNIHHKDWPTCFGETARLVNSVICYYIFYLKWSYSDGHLSCFHLWLTLTVLLFWIYFFPQKLVLVLEWLFLHWEFWSCCYLSFYWPPIKCKTGWPISLHSLWLFSCRLGWSIWSFFLNWDSLHARLKQPLQDME